MPVQWLFGKALAETFLQELKIHIRSKRDLGLRAPKLAVILVGNDRASALYVNRKVTACEKTGILCDLHQLPENIPESELLSRIQILNQDSQTDGILIQLPLPQSLSTEKIIEAVEPLKDVDGFHSMNLGKLVQGVPDVRPCTPYGIMELLKHYQINLSGLHAVVIGASIIVGRPMSLELLNAGCTVTICHAKTKALSEHVKSADILISAVGKRNIVSPDWVKPHAIVIDVGINLDESGKTCGDMDAHALSERVSYLTPVPGGVGPMTVAMLLKNTYHAYLRQLDQSQEKSYGA